MSRGMCFDTALDGEARRRGCSVYLVDRVIPMLPETLSNQLCSLVPARERLTMSVDITLRKSNGQVLAYEIFPSVIASMLAFPMIKRKRSSIPLRMI